MRYAISCGHQLTAWAAEEALRAGGNALDGAIAAFAMSWVTEPCMSGPGGGGFALVHHEGRMRAMDFFTQTPINKRPVEEIEFVPVEVDFGGARDVFHIGHGSAAVPGAVHGIFTLHQMGARMPMTDLFAPAIQVAREGHPIGPFQHHDFVLLQDIVRYAVKGRELYFDGDTLKPVGAQIFVPQLADFMEHLAREGADAFYRGEVAVRIAEACAQRGGHLIPEDLAAYRTKVGRARLFTGQQYHIHTANQPSVGGKLLIAILEASARHLAEGREANEAMARAIRDVYDLRDQWFTPGEHIKLGGTSHLNVIDHQQNVVSLSMSIGEGSGFFVEGTEIHMNNMLGEANLLPDGLHTWRPATRLKSMMAPSICTATGSDRLIALGSGGSWRIPFMIAQVLNRILHHRQELSASIAAPRMQLDHDVWQVEPGHARPSHIDAKNWNEWEEQNLYFGGVHTAMFYQNQYQAVGDDRRYGVAAVNNA
ncbi:MAG: gamma-glutamyltransferase [Saprospiraceae bacterium]|nr:gamma-glutamyltransferase [Saprospiraceae bacterium]